MAKAKREYVGVVNGYFLYEMRRDNRKVISIADATGEELCSARDEKAAREWATMQKPKQEAKVEVKPEVPKVPPVK